MQAIRTTGGKYGTLIRAQAAAGHIKFSVPPDMATYDGRTHRLAAQKLVDKLGWNTDGYGSLVSGCLPDGSWCHVMTGRDGKGDI